MKKNILFFSIGAVSILSCAAALSFAPTANMAKADAPTNLGEINFNIDPGPVTFESGVHLLTDVTNSMSYDWSNRMYPAGTGSAIFNNNDMYSPSENRIHICKYEAKKYYIAFSDYPAYYPATRSEGDTITVKGNWISTMNGVNYTIYINEFTATWTNGKWQQQFIVPELETYDKVSLSEIASDNYDRVAIDTEKDSSGWNTFAVSPENTTNSFAFEFNFESYSVIDKTLTIRFGGDAIGDKSNHFYRLCLNNTWGPNGVIIFDEFNKTGTSAERVHQSYDLECNLKPGARHLIECASIVVKNSDKVYNYVKYDGAYLYQDVFTPKTIARTTRISMEYGETNIFVGGTTSQKANSDVMNFDYSDGGKGLYLISPDNNIPVLDNWKTKGAPASKYNMLKNGEAFYPFTADCALPLTKYDTNLYYISFADFGASFKKGDVMTIGGEFHFYANNKAYVMALIPFSVEFNGLQFEVIDDLDDYLIQAISNYVDLDNYASEQQATITSIIQTARASILNATSMQEKWAAFNDGKALLDEVQMLPEKLQEYKQAAINQVNALVDEDKYEPDQLAIVQGYVNDAITAINAATSVKRIREIVEETKEKVAGVTTKQAIIEQRVLALEDGYEQYLESNEIVTTSDICASGDLMFYPKDDIDHESYSSTTGPDSVYSRYATNENNEYGNAIFQFKYQSTNPASRKYQAQVFVRMRGNGANCYIFDIAKDVNGSIGVGLAKFVEDTKTNEQNAVYSFTPNTEYDIECGAIDLKNYDRTFLFMKINGDFVLKTIVDRHEISVLTPTILFLDSHTADGSGETVTLSPYETGTTKNNLATSIGRPKLDNNSSSESLTVSFRKNSLPVGAKLYSMSEGAYTYNGNEIASYRPAPVIAKTSDTKYSISLAGLTIADGDTIYLGGCFAIYNEDANLKTVFKVSETTFTYNAASNSWSQSAPSLEDARAEAIDYLNTYVNLSDYSATNAPLVQAIIDDYTARINNATSVADVDSLLNAALAEIDAVPTALSEYKSSAKEELAAYKSPSIYRDNEQAELSSILSNAYSRIDACSDKDSVDYIVSTTKQAIDALKTASEYDAEELASEKRLAKTEIETYIGLVEIERYSDENAATIQQLALKARQDVDNATSIEEVRNIVSQFKEDIKNVSTKDGSVFDGEKYIEKGSKKKGCFGGIVTISIIVPVLSLVALVLLLFFRKKYILSK